MGWGMMGYDDHWFGHPWAWLGHGLWFLVVVGLAVAVVVVLARYLFRADSADKSALRILEDRYARGEIDREDFIQRKRDLS